MIYLCFIELKNFLLVLVLCILLIRNFIVEILFMGWRILCSIYIFFSLFFDVSRFLWWVLDLLILMVGKICFFVIWRFRCNFWLLVFLNFLKIILFIFELVFISVVVSMVRLLFFLIFCVVLKKCLGFFSVWVLILLVSILLEDGMIVLYVWVKWVIEFSRIMIFCLCLIRCLVFFNIIFVIWMCCEGGLLKVLVIILLCIVCRILVIFLGCLLISNIIKWYFGLLCVSDCVMFCSIRVLLVFGGDIIKLCWFLLMGVIRLIVCVVMFLVLLLLIFIRKCCCGNNGVRFLNRILFFVCFGWFRLILLIFNSVK